MGHGSSSWQDRNHFIGKSNKKKVRNTETTPTVGSSVGTEGYDDTKSTTAIAPPSNPQVGESIMNSGGKGSNETYDFSKGSKVVSITSKRRKSSLKVSINGAGGTGRNIV